MTTQAWKEVFDHIRYNPDPMTPILERVHRANAERLERQAERLIKRGYRVEELVNVQMAAWLQDPPMVIGGKEITVPPWGNIEPKEDGPSWSVLALRRLGRLVRPYKIPTKVTNEEAQAANESVQAEPRYSRVEPPNRN